MAINLDRLDEIKIVDSAGDELGINADGSINSVVTATDLDIRDLSHLAGKDSVQLGDGTILMTLETMDLAFDTAAVGPAIFGVRRDADTSPVTADGDAHPLVFDNGGRLKTDASITLPLDADDAAATVDPLGVGGVVAATGSALGSVSSSGDRYHLLGDAYRRTFINKSHNVGWQTSVVAVGVTAAEIAATPLDGRQTVLIQNTGNDSVFVGESNLVTTANGIEISKKSSMEFELGQALNLWVISASAAQEVRVIEAA